MITCRKGALSLKTEMFYTKVYIMKKSEIYGPTNIETILKSVFKRDVKSFYFL